MSDEKPKKLQTSPDLDSAGELFSYEGPVKPRKRWRGRPPEIGPPRLHPEDLQRLKELVKRQSASNLYAPTTEEIEENRRWSEEARREKISEALKGSPNEANDRRKRKKKTRQGQLLSEYKEIILDYARSARSVAHEIIRLSEGRCPCERTLRSAISKIREQDQARRLIVR